MLAFFRINSLAGCCASLDRIKAALALSGRVNWLVFGFLHVFDLRYVLALLIATAFVYLDSLGLVEEGLAQIG